MKINFKIFICTLGIIGVCCILICGCQKRADNNNPTPNPTLKTVTDIDGNVYHTVKIGTQVLLVENLKTTKYNDGSPIPNVTNDANWGIITTGAYCDYDNIPGNSTSYGKLYN